MSGTLGRLTTESFRASLSQPEPPPDLSPVLLALWYDACGRWDDAHRIAQDTETPDSAWVHAYLHRKEGDLVNAAYWYRHAGRPVGSGPLDEEWLKSLTVLLGR